MRVLMISWEYPPRVVGGLARHVQELARAIARSCDVHVVTCSSPGAKPLERDFGVWVHRVEPLGPVTDDFLWWTEQLSHAMLARAAGLSEEDGGFQIVHAHDWLAAMAAAGVKREFGTPLAATIHATEWGRNGGLHNAAQRRISDIEWYLCYEACRVIVCSNHMRSEVMRIFGLPEDKVRVIPNGVCPEQFSSSDAVAPTPEYARPDKDVILYVGRLVHEKGVQLLIEAMPKILSYWPSGRLVIAGCGPAEGDLRDLAARLGLGGKVVMTGFISDQDRNALYRAARVAVVPSLYEPFGITALEAMAAHTPLVVADTGGLSEIVRHGENGWKFYVENPNSLADAILHLLHCPEEAVKLAEAAYRDVLETYDWMAIARQTVRVYQSAIEISLGRGEEIAQ
ncbi:MAG: glycosyltransferase family 4 protein [Clostridia bacterium]|nr:glycosyltransferase family 4 protein [Clostridia bacterium]